VAFGAFSTTSSAPIEAAPRRRSPIALLLLAPGLGYLALFFLVPFVSLIMTSVQSRVPGGDVGEYQFDFVISNYATYVDKYSEHIGRSFGYALAATVLALLFSYPLAYFIGVTLRRFPLLQALGLTLVIAPFFISFLLRTLAWKQLLSDEGIIVGTLKSLTVLGPDAHITGTAGSVIFGLAYNFIPFMTLPIYTSLERLDLRFVEAGGDLYASPVRTFFSVTLPLSAPGVVSGVLLTFIPASGDFVNASNAFLGSSDTAMIGNAIELNFFRGNYPEAATLSIVLMGAIIFLIGIYILINRVVFKNGTEDLLS
jgi:spermidine/putrescine transport system permease protein